MSKDVLMLCGSLQAKSTNRTIMEAVGELLSETGRAPLYSAPVDRIPAFNSDIEDHPPSSVTELRKQIDRAAAVVIFSPEYAAAIPGTLKNALDWIVGSGELYGKTVGVVTASASGGEHARAQLIRTLTWQGCHVVAELGIVAPKAKIDPDSGRIIDSDTMASLSDLTSRVVEASSMSVDDRLSFVVDILEAAGIDSFRAVVPVEDG